MCTHVHKCYVLYLTQKGKGQRGLHGQGQQAGRKCTCVAHARTDTQCICTFITRKHQEHATETNTEVCGFQLTTERVEYSRVQVCEVHVHSCSLHVKCVYVRALEGYYM